MNISLNTSGTKTINNANLRAERAGQAIAKLATDNNADNSRDAVAPLVNLKVAEIENAAGVKLLQTEKKMLGSILDIRA